MRVAGDRPLRGQSLWGQFPEMSDVALLARLVFGFAVLLAPGAVLARAIGVRRASATLAWALAKVLASLTVTFIVTA